MKPPSYRRSRKARTLVALAFGIMAACSSEAPSGAERDGYRSVPWSDGKLLDADEAQELAREFMTAAGCELVTGRPPAGAVWVMAPPAPAQRFDCNHVSPDSAQSLARAARLSLASAAGGAHAYADPGWWEIETEETYSCSGTGSITITAPEGKAGWVTAHLDYQLYWTYWMEPGVPTTFYWPTGCGWVEKVTATKFGGGGTPLPPEPGEFPNTGGGGGPSRYPTNEPQLLSISVTPGDVTVSLGRVQQFWAELSYNNGAKVEQSYDVEWNSSSSIAVRDDYGTFMTLASGLTTITATLGSVVGTSTLLVHEQEYACDLRNDRNFGGTQASYEQYQSYLKARCLQDFTQGRLDTLVTIRAEANAYIRPFESFTDTLARAQCTAALAAADTLLSGGLNAIWMGKDNTVFGNNKKHNAQSVSGSRQMHFDPAYWKANAASGSGRKKIFRTLMHEAVHAILGDPDNPDAPDHPDVNPDYPNRAYFKFIEVTGPNSCLLP